MTKKGLETSRRLKKLGFVLAGLAATAWMLGYFSPPLLVATAGEKETFTMMAGLFCCMSLFCFGGAKMTANSINI
jgi:hypothetical protein